MVGYHKPFSGLDDNLAMAFGHDDGQQGIHEAAAWQVAKGMGAPWDQMVPPCVIREVNGQVGSLALERPGRNGVRAFEGSPEWTSAAFFDAVIGQQDRHSGNYLVAGDRITMIDHGYAFARKGDYLNWSQFQDRRVAFDRSLTTEEHAALDKLLASPDLFGLRGVLEPERADAMVERARRMKSTGQILTSGTY